MICFPTRLSHLHRYAPALLLTPFLSGCAILSPEGCDAYATMMLAVDVTDFRTGQRITGPFTVVVFSAATGDSVVRQVPSGVFEIVSIPEGTFGFPSEGRYSVEARAGGFKVWRRDQILVEEEGRCNHPRTTGVVAALIPLS